MIDEIPNLLASIPQNPEVTRDPAYLNDILVIVLALLLGLTCLIVLRLLEKGTMRAEIWLLWFSFIIALFCWVTSRIPFMNMDTLSRFAPAVGMIVAIAVNVLLVIERKSGIGLVANAKKKFMQNIVHCL